ncbi:hypothetical protein evm_012432 [Chilo suppressalis]|nr:hypothetical protein evm_012432 [Chilo suppressalis]
MDGVANTPIHVPTAGAQAFPMDGIGRLGHDPPRGPTADWRVLTTAEAAGANGLTCLSKHEGARDSKVLVTHPMNDHCESNTNTDYKHEMNAVIPKGLWTQDLNIPPHVCKKQHLVGITIKVCDSNESPVVEVPTFDSIQIKRQRKPRSSADLTVSVHCSEVPAINEDTSHTDSGELKPPYYSDVQTRSEVDHDSVEPLYYEV